MKVTFLTARMVFDHNAEPKIASLGLDSYINRRNKYYWVIEGDIQAAFDSIHQMLVTPAPKNTQKFKQTIKDRIYSLYPIAYTSIERHVKVKGEASPDDPIYPHKLPIRLIAKITHNEYFLPFAFRWSGICFNCSVRSI